MNHLQTIIIIIFLCLLDCPIQGMELPWNGVDASELTQVKKGGAKFYEWSQKDNRGWETPVPMILKNHGIKVVHLRLWHSPKDGVYGLAYTLNLAQKLKKQGIKILLDIHFSDTWADPGRQMKPAAWKNKYIYTDLHETIRTYVRVVAKSFISKGITLVGVQLGNETPSGMLWPDGRVGGSYDTLQQWWNLGELFKYARQGLELAYAGKTLPKVVIHLDHGGNKELYHWFFNNLIAHGVKFGVIVILFYPWWHGKLSNLKANLEFCVNEFGKDVAVIEAGYPWTLQWYDSKTNIVGMESQLYEGYPVTREGQYNWFNALTMVAGGLPNKRGLGVITWGATLVTSPGFQSPWENVVLFDAWGYPNPVLWALKTAP